MHKHNVAINDWQFLHLFTNKPPTYNNLITFNKIFSPENSSDNHSPSKQRHLDKKVKHDMFPEGITPYPPQY